MNRFNDIAGMGQRCCRQAAAVANVVRVSHRAGPPVRPV